MNPCEFQFYRDDNDGVRIYLCTYLFGFLRAPNYTIYGLLGSAELGGGKHMGKNKPDSRRYRMVFSIALGSFSRAADRSEEIERG